MDVSFDVIGDLDLKINDCFNWENKATSLYCIITGNLSSDLQVVDQTLRHLSTHYSMVFYIPGSLECENIYTIKLRHAEIIKICKKIKNIVYLHNHLIMIDGVAMLAINGWYDHDKPDIDSEEYESKLKHKASDILYLHNSIAKLQLHLDIKNIVVVSSCVPSPKLYFGTPYPKILDEYCLIDVLVSDSERKISHWVFGGTENTVDLSLNGIRYINNPYYGKKPYWPKRIELKF